MLTVETGSVVALANSYVSLVEFAAFIGSIPQPAATDPELERALILATRYIDGHYRNRWKGSRVLPQTQPLQWPRYGIRLEASSSILGGIYTTGGGVQINNYILSTTIPQRLKDATCEAALRALTEPLAKDTDSSLIRKKVDVLEWEWKPGAVVGQKTYQVIDQLLSDYLRPSGNTDLVRG